MHGGYNAAMKMYAVIAFCLVLFGGVAYWFMSQKSPSSASLPSGAAFVEDGHIAKNNPGLKPGVWFLSYEKPGESAQLRELSFSADSICSGKTTSGTCAPEIFIQGRSAHVEGIVSDSIVRVQHMTFTTPVPAK